MDTYYDMKVGFNHQVNVTHVNDPKSFFVRSAEVTDLMNLIESPGVGPVSASALRLGQRVVYISNILNKFVRGDICIVNVDGNNVNCDIFVIDYGCSDKSVSRRHIHSPDGRAEPQNQCPGLAFHCQLYLCEPKGEMFGEEVIEMMKSFVGEHTATITVISKINNLLVVELRTVDCPRDVGTMLGLIGLTTFTKGSYAINRFTNSMAALNLTQVLQYKHKQLNVGDILHVRVQSGTSVSGFYVADINDFKMLRTAEASFSEYCKNRHMKDEDYVPGRPCAVKLYNLDQYERAIIKKVNPNSKAVVQLIDWGKEIESNFSCIRSIDKEFYLSQPIIAFYCSTMEEQLWVSSLPSFFFKGYEFGIKIMELGNNYDIPHKVNIYPVHMLKYKTGGVLGPLWSTYILHWKRSCVYSVLVVSGSQTYQSLTTANQSIHNIRNYRTSIPS